jgi:anti-anti-sigma factor
MEMPVHIAEDKARISLPQNFDMQIQTTFRKTYSDILNGAEVSELEIDFSDVTYIDSSALGNLLLLRQRAENVLQHIRFTSCQPAVMQTLKMANFHRIFDIHSQ